MSATSGNTCRKRMRRHPSIVFCSMFFHAWLVIWGWCLSFSASTFAADPPLKTPHSITSAGATSIGVKECAACHSAPSPIYNFLGVTRFVRLVEAKEWLEQDKHAYAYQLVRQDLKADELKKEERISNKLSMEITARLNWKFGDGKFEQKCLTCHVGMDAKESIVERSNTIAPEIEIQFGVQCESCHGPGSEYTKREHHQQVSWRTKTPEQKSELGMWDLSSPSTAAKVCLSCHLGDIDAGRFVTHDMYAAGHPVLPPFDLQVFLSAMPPHWKTLQEKPTFEKSAEYNRAHFDIPGNTDEIQLAIRGSYDRTRRSMIGGLVANDLGIELIHRGAADPKTWGDYSIYNCMGCHQELKKNSTQVTRESRTPGRPFPANWLNLEYPRIHATNRETHETLTREMLSSFNSVPFGDALRIHQLSERHLQSLSDRFQDRRKMERQVMTKKDVLQWLEYLIASRNDSLTDFWVAKQTAWMVCVAMDELVKNEPLANEWVSPMRDELRDLLHLDLHLPQQQSVLTVQKSMLGTAQNFDSARCKELLNRLVEKAISNQ